MLSRRRVMTLILGAPVMALSGAALAADDDVWRGFRIELSALDPDRRAPVLASLHRQIDIVESLAIRPGIKAWFRDIEIIVNPQLRQPGRYGRRRLEMAAAVSPADNPVLLHEMLHGYHFDRLEGGRANPEVIAAWTAARDSGHWPDRAYMLTNPGEFFAMTASVALWGRAARPPATRAALQAAMPDWYDWLVREFGLEV
ncbi:MAG: hypothetical protein GC145_01095 [Caulobacter sp.]|nr:hypothetical protein [Caulobacter sp.]